MIIPVLYIFIFTPLVLFYSLYKLYSQPELWRSVLPLLILSIFCISYSFKPTGGSDLVGYFDLMKTYGRMSFSDVMASDRFGVLYITKILFWFGGRFHQEHLITAISATTVYGVSYYITCDYAERNDFYRYIFPSIIFQSFLLPYVETLSNLRNIFAFSVVILGTYFDFIVKKNRKWSIFLYVASVLIHSNALVIIIFRFIAPLLKRTRTIVIAVLIAAFGAPLLIQLAVKNVSVFSGLPFGVFIENTINNAYFYTVASETYSINTYNSLQDFIHRNLAYFFSVLIIIYTLHRTRTDEDQNKKNYYVFLCLIGAAILACRIFQYNNYWRFLTVYAVAGSFLIIDLKKDNISFFSKIMFLSFWTVSLAMNIVILYIERPIVDYPVWGENILINDIYVIIFKLIYGLFAF